MLHLGIRLPNRMEILRYTSQILLDTLIDVIYQATFGGAGRSLTERAAPQATHNKPEDRSKSYNWGSSGQSLSSSKKQVSQRSGKAAQPSSPARNSKSKQKERSPTPDWGVDDDDVIMIDSD